MFPTTRAPKSIASHTRKLTTEPQQHFLGTAQALRAHAGAETAALQPELVARHLLA